MSQRDLPLWARAAAALLVVFASWWLVRTSVIRTVIGPSVAWIGTGVVAAFVLRGMHLPLGLWPDGPVRPRFRPAWVIGTTLVFAALVVLGNPATAAPLGETLDPGLYAVVIIGVAGWSFAVAFVEQRQFVPWLIAAVALAAAPALAAMAGGAVSTACVFAMDAADVPCAAGMVQAAAFTTAAVTAAAFVSHELAFRRMILGRSRGAGLVLVVGSAAAAVAWEVALHSGHLSAGDTAWWAAAGLSAGALYACSGSLLVSSLYTGLLAGGDAAVRYGTIGLAERGGSMLAVHVVAALVLAGIVVQRNGLQSGLSTGPAGEEPGVGYPQDALEDT